MTHQIPSTGCHHRNTRAPTTAPLAAQSVIATAYHVTTNGTESVGQYIAQAMAPMPPETALNPLSTAMLWRLTQKTAYATAYAQKG
ncbi:MAG: hypothetical protein FD124_118 [Alphaproteobacteria bacterium]|nr:MAG: hypothetical protein FD160_3031 [Caulobacteraceae bacterium]TPW08840.1 MAG: hypothetical protein FD124_118 [Alphaproteobacteria bacterium]